MHSPPGIIYATTPLVEAGVKADGHHIAASGGRLDWARHLGRDSGTFVWDGPHAVGKGWGAFKHVFSGGNGVIYVVEDSGDLTWWRHLGVEDGSFRWEGPRKVGTGWGGFQHVFCGGDGVIYVVEDSGDLTWWRHLGVEDGGVRWEGPHKVAAGWGNLEHVFGGGGGVIYTIDAPTEARVDAKGHVIPASGGRLQWWRHLGGVDGSASWQGPRQVGTGWADLRHVFSGGDGVIYTVHPATEARITAQGRRIAASGGNLDWWRHVGRDDGSSRWEGPHTVGRGWGASPHVFADRAELSLASASEEITRYWSDTLAVTTVGSPTGPVIRTDGGDFIQPHNFGTIIKPKAAPPEIGDRFHVTVMLAGIRCFATDDPFGTDEPYVITSVYALDSRQQDKSAHTSRHGPGDIGDIEAGDVFAQNRDLAVDFAVPGDGDIRLHLDVFDVEAISDPEKAKQEISRSAQAAILAACAAITLAFPPAGAIVDGVVAALKVTGLLDVATDAIGSVAELFSDDLLGGIDLRIPNEFLVKLKDDPASLERTSDSIGGVSYNFPQSPEDDSAAGRSWIIDNAGKGTYRPFFRVILTER
jgi:hypothetical protein